MPDLLLPALSATALGLLVVVTLGVAYLTLADWRDRRRQENEKRETGKIKARKR
ncbi:MAG: hypothetical protein SWY16_09445 [Cyanobacteriota bacterium]|nr:hypothetical protein [Cyanobacteriota bacterium]